jgi:hypothetical protein
MTPVMKNIHAAILPETSETVSIVRTYVLSIDAMLPHYARKNAAPKLEATTKSWFNLICGSTNCGYRCSSGIAGFAEKTINDTSGG